MSLCFVGGVHGVEKAIVDVAHPDGCAMSAAWWWASLSSLIIPRLVGIHCGECHCRRGTPKWACHVSHLVVGVMVGVCIIDFVDDVNDMGVGLTWCCGGHDGGVGWWWLRGRDVWHGLCQCFLIWQVPKRSYVNINLYTKKCHHGSVGYITEKIPIVLGSILKCVTFFVGFISTIKTKVI